MSGENPCIIHVFMSPLYPPSQAAVGVASDASAAPPATKEDAATATACPEKQQKEEGDDVARLIPTFLWTSYYRSSTVRP